MNRLSSLLFPLLAAICLSWSTTAVAASHREAPQIAMDPTADITDVYFFRSWEDWPESDSTSYYTLFGSV